MSCIKSKGNMEGKQVRGLLEKLISLLVSPGYKYEATHGTNSLSTGKMTNEIHREYTNKMTQKFFDS